MNLEKIDFEDFFKDEYSFLNNGEGIGASGLITPLQMINIVNLPLEDKSTKEVGGWGSGYHIDTLKKILELIYNLKDKPHILNDKIKIYELLEKLITIRYVNQYKRTINKTILIKIPPYITSFQYESLRSLNGIFELISKKYNVSICVLINGQTLTKDTKEVLKEKIFDVNKNSLKDALDYIKEHNHIKENTILIDLEETILSLEVSQKKDK